DFQELHKIVTDSPKLISLKIPYQNREIEVQLYREKVMSEQFQATDENGTPLPYTPGKYYRGIVKGEYSSLAALSFFDGNVMGVISSPKLGNIVIGKSKDQKDFVVYADQNLLGKDPFVCGVENMDYNIQK